MQDSAWLQWPSPGWACDLCSVAWPTLVQVSSFAAERTFQEKMVCLGSPGAEAALLQEPTGKSHCQPLPVHPQMELAAVLVKDHGEATRLEKPGIGDVAPPWPVSK